MKAEDLMIGDLLRVSEEGICIEKGMIVEVRAINEDDFLKYDGKELKGAAHCKPISNPRLFDGGVWCAYLEPIPLTAKILEKNGFTEEAHYVVSDTYMPYYYTADEHFWLTIDGESIFEGVVDYVHDLQHVLRLCGIEKEITL